MHVRVLEKDFWELKIPDSLSSVKIESGESQENGVFWDLGEELEEFICYEGHWKDKKNERKCTYYHNYSSKAIAKQQEFENQKQVELVNLDKVCPEIQKFVSQETKNSLQFLKNGEPKFIFEKDKFSEFFEDGVLSYEVELLETGAIRESRYYPSGTLKEVKTEGSEGYSRLEYYPDGSLKQKKESESKLNWKK